MNVPANGFAAVVLVVLMAVCLLVLAWCARQVERVNRDAESPQTIPSNTSEDPREH